MWLAAATLCCAVVIGLLSIGAAASVRAAESEVAAGAQLAKRWCAACHIVSANQNGSVPQGPPSFVSVARSGLGADRLRAFLSHPHGAMPDLALTRSEIDELAAYIGSLR